MRKAIIVSLLLLASIKSFGQVTKSDVDALLATFPPNNYEWVYLSNVRTYYTDGSNSLEQKKYYGNKMNVEAKETGIYLRFFTDPSKVECNDLEIIPYARILRIEAWKNGILIDLIQ